MTTTAKKTKKEKDTFLNNITKCGTNERRPFFGSIELAMFEKLHNKIMKSKLELYFEYDKLKNKFFADTHDCSKDHLTKLFRMIKEAKYLASIYQEMYSEDPKYFHSFQFFKNEELEAWMNKRLNDINGINDNYHFDEVEGKLFVRMSLSNEKYSVSKENIVFFNKSVPEGEESTETSITFSIGENFELTTTTNIARMANTLYRTVYALNPHKLEMCDATPIDHARLNIDFKNPINNKLVIELDD